MKPDKMWKFLAIAVVFSFGVSAEYFDENWLNYGSDIQRRFLKVIGLDNFDRWSNNEEKVWYNGLYGEEKYGTKGVYIGYDDGYKRNGIELKVNEEKVTDENNIVRPCSLNDWQCIRKMFAYNSQCSPAYGPVPDPLYIARHTLYLPSTSMTVTITDVKITGLGSAKIRDFYVNKRTGNLVFAINVQNLNQTTKAYFNYRRTAKESIVLADYATTFIKSITLTAVLPKDENGLRLEFADIHATIDDIVPVYTIGPKAITSKDPEVIKAVAELNLNIRAVVREGFTFLAQLYTAAYIQQNVCDFGLKLYSV